MHHKLGQDTLISYSQSFRPVLMRMQRSRQMSLTQSHGGRFIFSERSALRQRHFDTGSPCPPPLHPPPRLTATHVLYCTHMIKHALVLGGWAILSAHHSSDLSGQATLLYPDRQRSCATAVCTVPCATRLLQACMKFHILRSISLSPCSPIRCPHTTTPGRYCTTFLIALLCCFHHLDHPSRHS